MFGTRIEYTSEVNQSNTVPNFYKQSREDQLDYKSNGYPFDGQLSQHGVQAPSNQTTHPFIDHSNPQLNNLKENPFKALVETIHTKPASLKCHKDDLGIKCSKHPELNVERVCIQEDLEKTRLICWDCILEEAEFWKQHKDKIVPIEDYITALFDKFEQAEDLRSNRVKDMPDYVREFMDKSDIVNSNFKRVIDSEKYKADDYLKECAEEIVKCFSDLGENVKSKLSLQGDKFEKNLNFMKEKIEENYVLEGFPTQREIISNMNTKSSSDEADQYLRHLNQLLKKKDSKMYEGLYQIQHKSILKQMETHPEFEIPDTTKAKMKNLMKLVKDSLEEISLDLQQSIKKNKISDLSRVSTKSTKRGLSNDSLSGFQEFEEDLKFNLRLNKRLLTDLNQPINCIVSIDSNMVAVGGQDGTVSVYTYGNCQQVSTHKVHKDYVGCLATLCHKETYFVISGGGGLDNRIIVWNIAENFPFQQLSGHESSVLCMTTTSNERSLISGGNDNYIIIWDLATGVYKKRIQAHSSIITNLKFLPTVDCVVSGGWDSYIRVWKLEYKNDEIGKHISDLTLMQSLDNESPVLSQNSCQIDSTFQLAGSSNNKVTVWNLSTGCKENEMEMNGSANEIVLIENKYSLTSPDFMVLNTNSLEEGMGQSITKAYDGGIGDSMKGFKGQGFNPRVQLIEVETDKSHILKLVKVGWVTNGGYCLNIYDIV